MSVGHVARLLEEAGIPTVVIATAMFRARLAAQRLPRLVLTRNLMGRTLGAPGDRERQRAALLAGLELLDAAEQGETIVELPDLYRPVGLGRTG